MSCLSQLVMKNMPFGGLAKGYDYQYLFCQNSGHGIHNAKVQFMPHALEWVWHGYQPKE